MNKRIILLVIDSLGVGYMEDVKKLRLQDKNANTLYHILEKSKHTSIPNLEKLGINKLINYPSRSTIKPIASYGVMELQHYGADSYMGHQEIMGSVPLKPTMKPFSNYIDRVKKSLEFKGFKTAIPDDDKPYLLIDDKIIVADNIETDYGQIYNVTAPLSSVPFEEVITIGKIVRENVEVSRVIALGGEDTAIKQIIDSIEVRYDGLIGVNSPKSGVYNKGYKALHLGYGIDYKKQAANIIASEGKEVTLIGKMQDIIYCENAYKMPLIDTTKVMEGIIASMEVMNEGLIAATVQETDLAGHSQDVDKYAEKLMIVDCYLGSIIKKMNEEDLLFVTADHGNDPTIGHSQHTREKVPILVYGEKVEKNINLGVRQTLSDVAASIADYFKVSSPENGSSFMKDITSGF